MSCGPDCSARCYAFLMGSAPPARFRVISRPAPQMATRTRVDDSRVIPIQGHLPWRAVAGRPAGKRMIMTRDRARKTAARQRMAETGEPYVVARKAVGTGDQGEAPVRAAADDDATPDEQYAREAAEAGIPAAQIESQLAAFRARDAAVRAREEADRAEETADEAEQLAMVAQDAADEAEDWADEQEHRRLRQRADEAQHAADSAREKADQAEEVAADAEERAELAEDAADSDQALVSADEGGRELRSHGASRPLWGAVIPVPGRGPRPPNPPRPPWQPR